MEGHNDSNDGSRGGLARVKDYKDHRRQFHWKHKGVRQWKTARSADWVVGKVRRGKSKLGGVFEPEEKTMGIEIEV